MPSRPDTAAQRVPVIDMQAHVFERDSPRRPWARPQLPAGWPEPYQPLPEATGQQLLDRMDRLGIDGTIVVSAWSVYLWDAGYALEVAREAPHRLRVVAPVDVDDSRVEDRVAELAATGVLAGVRVMVSPALAPALATGARPAVFTAAEDRDLPIALMAHDLAAVRAIARRHPGNRFVVDHLGLRQTLRPPAPSEPFRDLAALLELAAEPNVWLKVSGAATLSTVPYPFDDLREPLSRIFDAFGVDRCAWGSDVTRTIAFHTPEEGLSFLRDAPWLSPSDRAQLLGGTASELYRWRPGSGR